MMRPEPRTQVFLRFLEPPDMHLLHAELRSITPWVQTHNRARHPCGSTVHQRGGYLTVTPQGTAGRPCTFESTLPIEARLAGLPGGTRVDVSADLEPIGREDLTTVLGLVGAVGFGWVVRGRAVVSPELHELFTFGTNAYPDVTVLDYLECVIRAAVTAERRSREHEAATAAGLAALRSDRPAAWGAASFDLKLADGALAAANGTLGAALADYNVALSREEAGHG